MILERKYNGETQLIPNEKYSGETTIFHVDDTGMASRDVKSLVGRVLGTVEAGVHMTCALKGHQSKQNRFYKDALLKALGKNTQKVKSNNKFKQAA